MPHEIANTLFKSFTGAAAIAEVLAPGVNFRLLRVEAHWSSAPTTAQNITVTLDAGDGPTYDVRLDSIDPSVGSVTDMVLTYGVGYEYEADDEIDIAYTNTDTRTISGKYVFELAK